MLRNFGFSLKESGVGGSLEDTPRARSGLVGSVGRRERMLVPFLGNTYWVEVLVGLICRWFVDRRIAAFSYLQCENDPLAWTQLGAASI